MQPVRFFFLIDNLDTLSLEKKMEISFVMELVDIKPDLH